MTQPALIVSTNIEPGIVGVTLNRPERRNALSINLLEELRDTLLTAEANSANRVLVLNGSGPVFCAGLDLKEATLDTDPTHSAGLVARTLQIIRQSRLISIAAIQGAAVAGGAGLMAACDLVVIEDSSKVGFPEVHRGLVASIALNLLRTELSQRSVRELLLTGRLIDSHRVVEIGLANYLVPSGQSYPRAVDLAHQILQGGPEAVEKTKQLINNQASQGVENTWKDALKEHLTARHSLEATEGILAFVEKRPPKWIS